MAVTSTGPPGYGSYSDAITDLLRFGPAILTLKAKKDSPSTASLFSALLFHVERTTTYYKQSDQHGRGQAVDGVYSKRDQEWIRGPAGVSEATWKRCNIVLVDLGFIRPFSRFRPGTECADSTEYVVEWLNIRAAIQEWKDENGKASTTPLLDFGGIGSGQADPPSGVRSGQADPPSGVRSGQAGPTSGQGDPTSTPTNAGGFYVRSGQADPHTLHSLTFPEKAKMQSAAEVRDAIEAAIWPRKLLPNDSIPGEVLAIGERVRVPVPGICMWIREFAKEKRAAEYPITSPRLFVVAAATGLIVWRSANWRLIERWEREEYLRLQRECLPGSLVEMPPNPSWEKCPVCGEESVLEGVCHSVQCVDERRGQGKVKGAGGG